MTVIWHEQDESEDATNLTNWQTVMEKSGTVTVDGDFKIDVYCELTGNLTNRGVAVRVLIDDIERRFHGFYPDESDVYQAVSFHGRISISEGAHSIKLQYVSGHASQTAKIRRKSILLEKH